MSGVSKKAINRTLLSTSDMKSKTSSKDETIKFWNASFSRGTSGSSSSYLYNPFSSKSLEAKMSATPILCNNYLNAKKPVLKISNNVPLIPVTESKKRNRSKPGPASRKRSKKKKIDETSGETNLDTDLVAFVESMNTDKKLDSDSSTDTIIIDGEDTSISCGNNKTAAETNKINVFSTDNRTPSLGTNIPLLNNFASHQNEKFANSSLFCNNSSKTQNSYAPGSSVLKDYLSKNASNIQPVSNAFKFSSSLGTLSTIPDSSVLKSKAIKTTRKAQQKSFMYETKDLLTNKISLEGNKNINLPHTDVVKQPASSFQSIYASMGLDEDLCDMKSHKVVENLNSNFVPDSSIPSTKEIHHQDSVQNFANIPIKIEKDVTPPASPGNGESRICRDVFDESRNSLNKMHVDMTFEADPYDEEDDLPLSVLKCKVDLSSSDLNAISNQSTYANMPISLFIKKELVEDETVSQSHEISKNILSTQSSHLVSKVNLSSSLKTTENLLNSNSAANLNLEVKIKSEPITDFEYGDAPKTVFPEAVHQNPNLSAKSSNEIVPVDMNLSKKSKKGKQKNTKKKTNQNSIISPFSSNDDAEPSYSIDPDNAPEILNKEPATMLVVPKKNKVKKAAKRNTTKVQLEANYNLNSESIQNVNSCNSSVLDTNSFAKPLDIPCTALDTNCNPTIAENTAMSKKGKKKKIVNKSVHLDENLPITLLIKRQKTADVSTDGLDSFLCTNVSKSSVDEVRKDSCTENLSDKLLCSASCDNLKRSELLNSEELPIQNLDHPSSLQNSNLMQNSSKKKRKNPSKKKPAKKRDKFGKYEASQVSSEQDNEQSNYLNIINNKESGSPYDTNACKLSNLHKGTLENHSGKDNTVVHMSFEEQHSPPDASSEEFMNSILSVKKEIDSHLFIDSAVQSKQNSTDVLTAIKNIKKENDSITESESCEQSKSTDSDEQNSQLSTPVSEFSSELSSSNLNFKEVSNNLTLKDTNDSPSKSEQTDSASKKKKKGKKKSYGWYKKKKQRTKQKHQPIADASVAESLSNTEFYASTAASISDTEFNASAAVPPSDTNFYTSSAKQPVVVVKNLLPDIERGITSHEENKDYLNAESETDLLPKNKKKNSGKASKRKRAPVSNKKSPNKKLPLEASESENNSFETCKNTVGSPIQSSNSEKNTFENIPLEDVNTESVITRSASEETVYIPFDLPGHNQENEVIDISDSPVKTSDISHPRKRLHSPLIDVAEIAQEIAGLENLVHSYNKHNHGIVNNIISDSSERNTECRSKTPEIADIRNQPASVCNSSIKHSIGLNLHTEPQNRNLIEPLAKIKKEPDAYGTCEANIDSHPRNLRSSFSISDTQVHNSTSTKTQNSGNRSLLINSASIKTEESSDSASCSRSQSQNSNKASNTFDNNYPSESCSTNVSKNVESSQLKLVGSSDKIALCIKKEACSFGSSINSIRSQDELLNRASEICPESVINNLNINNACNIREFNSASQSLQAKMPITTVQNSTKTMTDDDIQILEVNAQKSKNVLCVDLTDDDASNVNSRVQDNNPLVNSSKHLSELCDSNKLIVHGNTISEKIPHDAASKEASFPVAENKGASESTKLPSERNIFQSSFNDDDVCPSTEKETIDPSILKQKYSNEYFRYPFLPSVASFHSKPQKKHKTYTRIHSQTLNLSIEKVESRLKNSDNIKHKFGNKLGDIVKLERYPVSSSEVKCYHRILGIAPSHKLLSKCFKSPDKSAGSVLDEFSLPEFQGQSSASKFESKNPSIICSLQDIIQGISASRMVCDKSNIQTPEVYKRDCPSVDTKDSCDSFTSSVSDRFVNCFVTVEKNDMKIKNSLLKDSDLSNVCQDASSSGRNSALSCAASDFQDSVKNDSAIESFSGSKNSHQEFSAHSSDVNASSFSQNILSYLSLPSKEVLASLVNNESNKSLTNMETREERTNTLAESEKEPVLSNDLHSLPNSIEQTMSAPPSSAGSSFICSNAGEDGNILQKVTNPVLNVDLPVTELRKILEVAGSFCPSSNSNEVNLWKNKETFEYNHTQSVPVTGVKSDQDLENSTLSLHNSSVAAVDDISGIDDVKDDPVLENTDDDYVDNEPQYCESGVDKNETSNLNEKEEEEPKIPQYKSKWEKIMERKSLESKQKEQINEHLLKDCFPVSSKVPSKKCNVPNKTSIITTTKISKSKKTESHEIKAKSDKTKAKTNKKAKAKSDQKSLVSAEKEQSKLISKKGKIVNNKIESNKDSKLLPKKKKVKYVDDATNLFVPDKPIKVIDGKKADSSNKTNDSNPAKRFYGNRITNRGTFLTESSSEFLKSIKIPKKKISEISKKPVNVRSEEFHSMVKSPDIDIEPRHSSHYDRQNIMVVTGKTNNYRARKKNRYFDRVSSCRNSSILLHPPERENLQNERTFMDSQPSDLFHSSYHESFLNRKVPLLNNSSFSQQANDENNKNVPHLNTSFHTNDESNPYKKIPVLNSPSISYPSKDASFSSTKVPFINIPPSTSMEFSPSKNILSNTSPPLALLQNILSTVHSNSSMASNDAALPFSGYLNPAWNNSQYPATPCQPYFSDVSDSMSDSTLTNTSSATDLPSVACNLVPGPPASSFQFHNQSNHSFDSASINSQFIASHGSNQILPKKAPCLVPKYIKSSVGHKTIETSNVRLLMLEWSVDWLVQQQKIHEPPPIYTSLKKVASSYDSFEDYYNTYFPLMLLDTWHRIYVSWTHLSQASPYFCEISSYSVKSNFVSVECQTVFNSSDHPKGVFPDEGSILMIKYGTKSNDFAIKILGYVTCVKTRRFNPVTDSKLCNFKPPKNGNFEILNVLTLTFMGAYNSEDIDKRLPIRIHVLCNVRSTLKQNDALLYISKSPLQRSILNPVEDGLLSFSLTPRNSPQDKINECVRDITKGILSPHPLPLLTVVRAVPESDRLNIIPLLIEKMKTGYKTKVLLCVRTVRALGDIAANICLHKSLKMVIINKRCDTGVQFQKYLLDELVASEMSKSEDGSLERHLARNEAVIRTKKQIFSECDVVLSLIRNSHDEFMETTFTETESVAQMCCIVDEANLCTEPETLIPILHGISKLILIGDPDYPAKVVSKTAKEHDYNRSFFHRAYDLDLITE